MKSSAVGEDERVGSVSGVEDSVSRSLRARSDFISSSKPFWGYSSGPLFSSYT